jgi:single-strand DNA-binding protein
MQRWFGVGRLTQDPELRYTTSGTAVCSFTIAVDRARKDAQGNKQTDFVPVIVWSKLGELCAQYLAKGRQVAVTGEFTSRSYENRDGQKVRVWEVVADQVQFLDRGEAQQQKSESKQTSKSRFDDDPFADDYQLVDVNDDNLPF